MPGLGLANAYGAAAAADELVDLLAARKAEQEYRELRAERARKDADAREEKTFNRRRLTEQDERQRRIDEQAEKDKNTTRLMKLAEHFPGARAPRSAFGDVPADLDALILKPIDPTIASRSITGYASTPDAPTSALTGMDRLRRAAQSSGAPAGSGDDPSTSLWPNGAMPVLDRMRRASQAPTSEINFETREAIAPGTVEIQEPESEKRRIADARATAAADKAEKDRTEAEQRRIDLEQHRERMAELARQRIANAAGRGGMTDTGQLNAIEKLNTKYQSNTSAAREVQHQFRVMEQGMAAYDKGLNKGTAEQSVVMAFNKILDPTSVVREGEYDRTSQGQSLLQRMHAVALKVPAGGQIAPAVLRDMVALSRTYRDQAAAHQQRERKRIERTATHFGLPLELILTDDEDDQAPAGGGAATGGPAGASTGAAGGSGFRIKSVRPAAR